MTATRGAPAGQPERGRRWTRRRVLEAGGRAGAALLAIRCAPASDALVAVPSPTVPPAPPAATAIVPQPSAIAAAAAPGTVFLGRPTGDAVTVSYLSPSTLEAFIEYGDVPGRYTSRTATLTAAAGVPVVADLTGLTAGRRHYYRMRFRTPGSEAFAAGEERSWQASRRPGDTFTFTIQADSHRDDNASPDQYRRTLANVRAELPDFHVDLGDTFMGDKFARTEADLVRRYAEERVWFGAISDTVPVLLTNGNHEGEAGWALNGTKDNLAVWASNARLRYYANPLPNAFYTGDEVAEPFTGRRASYYAWEWGDALCIVLDPYWFTKAKPGGRIDGWAWTLGERQYRWLEGVLGRSTRRHKLVFIHHLVGGLNPEGRGGAEAAGLWEWGGRTAGGGDEFAAKRPGWSRPIHRLLVERGVRAVFHGHDHLYARQELDGLVYLEVPQPSHEGENAAALAKEGGYASGVIRSSSGHVRVTVRPERVTIRYVKALLPRAESTTLRNGDVVDEVDLA